MGLSKLYDEGPLRLMQWLHRRVGWWAALVPAALMIALIVLAYSWILGSASH